MRVAWRGRGSASGKHVSSEKGGDVRRRIESGHMRSEMKVQSVPTPVSEPAERILKEERPCIRH